ncbi:hemocyte protein-glutamine gamma-glutamyltransferase-like isoform X2 [Mercenaria mercenaria]|nr:hemocyte protein-glutamine gamma-glutamyltransferase-like isoform X2 [Mercenaria mercenaria]XP_053404044.1 hemocyte protein-glutamine gamma-glutamyltransferase-like isoform X2 [Mercenaria mercenaria]
MSCCTGRSKWLDEYMSEEYINYFFTFYYYDPEVEEEKVPKSADKKETADDAGVLKVAKLDLNVETNTPAHHTDEFDITNPNAYDKTKQLVVRRGQEFTFTVKFNRAYDDKKDDLRLIFEFGKKPSEAKGSKVEFILSAKDVPKEWGAYIKPKAGSKEELTVVVTIPPTCAVGKWSLKIDVVKTKDKGKTAVFRYTHKDPIYILFNPWCKDDQVYMEDEKLTKEYVLNEKGKIYRGSTRRISPCPWNFGQFAGNVLNCVNYLLDEKSNMTCVARGDPVKVARKITSLVNSCDNNGVLTGNWSGEYDDGTSPLEWTGSVAILEEYFNTKAPVQFGQCWVFSGVVTTVCRALGIPARSITNFASAHDTDGSMTIDSICRKSDDGSLEQDEWETTDSVWNFHVWNEVWMARPELPKGYGGWQAIDATPQETSDGLYCMGPFPLNACKRGEVYFPHDGPFLFAEVNADRATWLKTTDGKMELIGLRKGSVGKYISTKRAFGRASFREYGISGDLDREDVTCNYKFPEGSTEERAAVHQANQSSTKKDVYQTGSKDVDFEICCDHDDTYVGQTLKLCLKVTNTSSEKRTVSGTMKVTVMFYTGVPDKAIHKKKVSSTALNGKETTSIEIEVPPSEYLNKLKDHCMLRLDCMFMVKETNQIFTDTDDFRLRKPHLDIEVPETGKVGKKFNVKVSFKNPLPCTLTKCILVVEGPGHQKPVTLKEPDVPKDGKFEKTLEMTPVKPGEKQIIVSFNCAQLEAVNVADTIDVTK